MDRWMDEELDRWRVGRALVGGSGNGSKADAAGAVNDDAAGRPDVATAAEGGGIHR